MFHTNKESDHDRKCASSGEQLEEKADACLVLGSVATGCQK